MYLCGVCQLQCDLFNNGNTLPFSFLLIWGLMNGGGGEGGRGGGSIVDPIVTFLYLFTCVNVSMYLCASYIVPLS